MKIRERDEVTTRLTVIGDEDLGPSFEVAILTPKTRQVSRAVA